MRRLRERCVGWLDGGKDAENIRRICGWQERCRDIENAWIAENA